MDESQSLAVVRSRGEKPLSLSALSVDLGSFLATAREVGTDAGLLLLAVRALTLRQNAPIASKELRWVLGAHLRDIRRWLDALEHSGLVVWHDDGGLLRLDIAATETERTLFSPDDAPGVIHRVPTFWFVRTLPLVGRRAFLVYLYLRSRERAAGLTSPVSLGMVARACGLRSSGRAARAIRCLRRARLVSTDGGRNRFLLTDPPPLTRAERLWLSLLSSGVLPPTPLGRLALACVLAAGLTGVVALILLALA
ncbi:MAG: hypothetical protein KA072_01960 [Thermoanaerobaculaceae bacterium]|nr:hypothetical protein [Thermoanaerobaculaceae bacterium]MDI9621608.1 hypothetical protein [Acidobacteriota bacterium]